jgi:hypothetical protein
MGSLAKRAAAAEDAITIEKNKPAIEYKRFDPAHLPDPPPPLEKGESAVCVYQFEMNANGRYSYAGPPLPADAPADIEVKVERMTVTVNLKVTIWLPKNAPPLLEAHEEGHRQIAEAFYADAEKVARGLATKVVGSKVKGQGKDMQSAGNDAMNKACQKLLDDYLAALNAPCKTAQDAYDRMTAHGINQRLTAKEAVQLAIKEAKTGKRER